MQDAPLPGLPGPVDRRFRRRACRRHARPGAARIAAGENAGADPRLADRALRRLGQLSTRRRADRPGRCGRRRLLLLVGGAWLVRGRFRRRRDDRLDLIVLALALIASRRLWLLRRCAERLAAGRRRACCSALRAMPGRAARLAGAAEARRDSSRDPRRCALTKLRQHMFGRFDAAEHWLMISESYQRRGDTREAAGVIRSAVREHPGDADLWVGLGNALVDPCRRTADAGGELAFRRAAELAPGHPAPRFFYRPRAGPGRPARRGRAALAQALAVAPANASIAG